MVGGALRTCTIPVSTSVLTYTTFANSDVHQLPPPLTSCGYSKQNAPGCRLPAPAGVLHIPLFIATNLREPPSVIGPA